MVCLFFFFVKQKTAYEMRISDWSSDVCSSDLRVRHDLHKRRRWQPVEGVLDGAAVVPFTFRQFGFNLIECPDLREARGSTVFIDIAQNIFRIDLIHEVSNLLNETCQVIRIVFAIHRLEGSGKQIQLRKRGPASPAPGHKRIIEQTFNEQGCLSWRNAGKPRQEERRDGKE